MEDSLRVPPPGPHPDVDSIRRARRAPEAEGSFDVLAHVALCATCSQEVLLQEAFDAGQALPPAKLEREWARFTNRGEASNVLRFPTPRRWVRPALALAATAAFAFLGVSLMWRDSGSVVVPGDGEEVVRGGVEELIRMPEGELTEPPHEFVFADITAPVKVTVFDPLGTYRWTSEPTTTGKVTFPETERAKLLPGTDYYWTLIDAPSSEAAVVFRVR